MTGMPASTKQRIVSTRSRAFKLNGGASGLLHYAPRVGDCGRDGNVVGEKRQVAHHEGPAHAAAHGRRVIDHLIEGGGESRARAVQHLGDAITHKK